MNAFKAVKRINLSFDDRLLNILWWMGNIIKHFCWCLPTQNAHLGPRYKPDVLLFKCNSIFTSKNEWQTDIQTWVFCEYFLVKEWSEPVTPRKELKYVLLIKFRFLRKISIFENFSPLLCAWTTSKYRKTFLIRLEAIMLDVIFFWCIQWNLLLFEKSVTQWPTYDITKLCMGERFKVQYT